MLDAQVEDRARARLFEPQRAPARLLAVFVADDGAKLTTFDQ